MGMGFKCIKSTLFDFVIPEQLMRSDFKGTFKICFRGIFLQNVSLRLFSSVANYFRIYKPFDAIILS